MADTLQLLIKSAFDATGITAATNSINRMDSQISRVTRAFSKFTGLLAGGTAGLAALSFLGRTNDAFKESEKSVNLFSKAYQNLGNFTRAEIQDQVAHAAALMKTTKYTDEQILAIKTQLVTYGLYGEDLKRATTATLDLAVKTGSTESAVKLMGKAAQGQTDTLARYGLKIDSNAKGSAKYAAVLAEVERQLGGLSAVEGENLTSSEKLGKSVDELYEKIGALVDGPLTDLVKILTDIVDVIPAATQAVYDGNRQLSTSDGILKTVFKSVWNNINPFKALGAAAAGAAKSIAGIKPVEDILIYGPNLPTTPRGKGPEKDEDWEKYMSPEQQAKRLEAVTKEQREQLKTLRDYDEFTTTDRGRLYTKFFGSVSMASRRSTIAQAKNSEDMKRAQQKVLRALERDYEAASHGFFTGFQQALLETESSLWNFRDGFNSAINGAVGPAQAALKDFFNMSSSNFMNILQLAEKTFKGILNAFYDMITQMIAKFMVFKMLTGIGLGGTAFGKFIGLATGGPIPGPKGAPVPILAHGGEFMLSANVVDAIKSGRTTSNLAAVGGGAAGGGGANISYSPTININGGVNGGNVREICRQIADAGRKGVTEALDAAKVLYKQGAKRSGETAL